MDLDAAADELYAGSPDDFVERRTALAAAARAARDRPLVKQILALRRPTRTAWLVNLLARERRTEVAGLLELGRELEDAQRRRDGPALRRLSAERRTRVDGLARTAVALGAEHGYPAPDAALQEVSQSLQAALADPAVGDLLRAGRLTSAVSYGGFGPSDLMAALAASLPAAPADGPAPPPEPEPVRHLQAAPEPEPEDPAVAEQRRAHQARVEEVEAAWEAAQAELDAAESAANDATAQADELADRIEELRDELARTESAETSARDAARAARRRHQEARRAVASAEQARDAVLGQRAEDG